MSAAYKVIDILEPWFAVVGEALRVGLVRSTLAAFEVWFVVLQSHALLQTFILVFVQVDADHSQIVQVTGVPDAIPETGSE